MAIFWTNIDNNRHSQAYMEIINLINLANDHRSKCDESCHVSLHLLKFTVDRLIKSVWSNERQDIILKITETKWF